MVKRALRWALRTLDGAGLVLLGWMVRLLPRARRPGSGVCVVTNTLEVGGVQGQLYTWLKGRGVERGEVRIIVLTGGGAMLAAVGALGVAVEVVEERFKRRWLGRTLLAAMPRIAYFAGVLRELSRTPPAVVWSALFLANSVAAPAARLAGVSRVVISERGLSAWKRCDRGGLWWYRRAERSAAALADAVVTNARAVAVDYAAWLGRSPESITVVYNGIDADGWRARRWRDLRRELAGQEELPVVLNVARLSQEKGQGLLLEAAARLWREGVPHRLVLVGSGEMEAPLGEEARRLGLQGAVIFAGETLDPQDYYRSADIFALTSLTEGLPNVLLEAAVFGLPAVTPDVGGVPEAVVDGETGLVVTAGEVAAVVAALRCLLQDRELRQRLGEAAARRVRATFPVERMVEEMERVLSGQGGEP